MHIRLLGLITTQNFAWVRVAATIVLCCSLLACATPVQRFELKAQELGYQRSHLVAKGFKLKLYNKLADVYLRKANANRTNHALHIYLEGDGTPWSYRAIVMPDPTPRSPLMLDLMALDPQRAVYLGRPCYNGTALDKGCDSRLWTSGRYSKMVVDSMASAIRVLQRTYKASTVKLFGHSGGGALAMLIAQQLPSASLIVSIAGNLDTDAWTNHHGYTPLYTSLNPANQPALPKSLQQWHLVGGRDNVIPPQLVKPFIMSQPSASGYLIDGYTHGCCWHRVWPEVINAVITNQPLTILGSQHFKAADELEFGQGSQ